MSDTHGAPKSGRDDELDDLDGVTVGWQPDPGRDGYERWFDGERLIGRPHRSPDPFSALSAST